MPSQITCPSCGGPLRVPEELFGRRVQCPTCQSIFIAEVASERPPAPTRPADAPGPPPLRAQASAEYEEVDDYDYRRPRRRWLQPHRGTMILVLGILSLVFTCFPLGIAAWVMGNTDLAAIRRGEMDPTGEGTTQAGRILGIISTVLAIVGCVGYMLMGFLMIGAHGNRF
jgi:hypothetical protein